MNEILPYTCRPAHRTFSGRTSLLDVARDETIVRDTEMTFGVISRRDPLAWRDNENEPLEWVARTFLAHGVWRFELRSLDGVISEFENSFEPNTVPGRVRAALFCADHVTLIYQQVRSRLESAAKAARKALAEERKATRPAREAAHPLRFKR